MSSPACDDRFLLRIFAGLVVLTLMASGGLIYNLIALSWP